MKRTLIILALALVAIMASATDKAPRRSTIHLKSGEYVTGVITSRNDQTVEIVTDGDISYVYYMDDVAYITHETVKKNYDKARFRGFIDLGYGLGFGSPRNDYLLIETSFGYQLDTHWYIGAGLGLHPFDAVVDSYPPRTDYAEPRPNDPDWKFPFIPIYAETRYSWRSENTGTPWASFKAGCGTFNHSGLFLAPSFGWHFATSQFFSFNVGIGYELHTATYKLWVTGDYPGAKPDLSGRSYVERTPALHNVVFKAGVEF